MPESSVLQTLEASTGVSPRNGESRSAYVDRLDDRFDFADADRERIEALVEKELFSADAGLSERERRELADICERAVERAERAQAGEEPAVAASADSADGGGGATVRSDAGLATPGGSPASAAGATAPERRRATDPDADVGGSLPGRADREDSPWRLTRADAASLLPLVVAGAFVFFYRLDAFPIQTWDEGFYGNLARHMVQDGFWVVPHMYYQIGEFPTAFEPWLRLPPLGPWLQALSMLAFGVNEFAVRFPSAVASLLTVVVVYVVGRNLGSRRSGFLAGLVYLTTPYVYAGFNGGRQGGVDALLVLFGSLFVYTTWLAVERDEPRWLYPMGLFAGLAVLTKGFGAGVFLLVVLPLVFFRQQVFLSKEMVGATGITALLALPWPAYMYSLYGDGFVQQFFVRYVFERAAGPAFGRNTNTLFAFMDYPYIKELLFAPDLLHPWSFVLVLLLPVVAYRTLFADEAGSPLAVGLVVWWLLAAFGLFVFIGNQQWYIMPMYVPAAVLVGWRLDAASRGSEADVVAVALGAALVLTVSPNYSLLADPVVGGRPLGGGVPLAAGGTALTLGVVLVAWFAPLHERLAASLPAQLYAGLSRVAPVLVTLLLVSALVGLPPTPETYAEQRTLADAVNRNAPASAPVFVEQGQPTAYHTFSFYAQRPLETGTLADFRTSDARYAVLTAESFARVQPEPTVLLNTTVTGGQNVTLVEVDR